MLKGWPIRTCSPSTVEQTRTPSDAQLTAENERRKGTCRKDNPGQQELLLHQPSVCSHRLRLRAANSPLDARPTTPGGLALPWPASAKARPPAEGLPNERPLLIYSLAAENAATPLSSPNPYRGSCCFGRPVAPLRCRFTRRRPPPAPSRLNAALCRTLRQFR